MEKNNKKTILVTGGAGFVGSFLCEKYLRQGHRVICVDNLSTNFSTENIDFLMDEPDFTFIKHDIVEPIKFKEKIDWIFNFACPAQCVNIQYDPIHTLKISVHGVINMLELAREHGAVIMQASTSEIYGHEPKMPQKESDCGEVYTLGPRACYDEGKRVSETLMMDYHRKYGVDIRIIRIFNTYGPRMYFRDGRVIANFINRALKNEDIFIYGDGSFTRSFQYVSDLVEGIDKMMNSKNFLGPVNLGNPHEITIKELAETVIKSLNSSSKIVYKKAVTDDPKRRKPDISLAKEKLGWEPKISLAEGLKKTTEYFKNTKAHDSKILVFSNSYSPIMGPAEIALENLTKLMPDTDFYIITSKQKRGLEKEEKAGNNLIYRVGFGFGFDKYLFPFLGAIKAYKLNKKNKFRFAWSIMASYGSLAALFLKIIDKNLNFLLAFDKSEIENRSSLKNKILHPILKLIFRKADSVMLSDAEMEKKAKFYNNKINCEIMDVDGKNLVEQVRYTYSALLDKQEKKLSRPM